MVEVVEIPGGVVTVNQGTRGTRAVIQVAPFRMARFAVTEALYASVMGSETLVDGTVPVANVSWLDAVTFCNRLSAAQDRAPCYAIAADAAELLPGADGYRLPTEAEWEHACRAGSNAPTYGPLDEIAWYRGNADGRQPAGRRAPNAWGLYDMLGNVWEWCWDLYDPAVYGPYRVFRGGGWADSADNIKASIRRKSHPTFRIDDLGFRVVLD